MKKTKIKKDLSNKIKEAGSGNKIRGITLISLVITIVVLIILAAVAINLSLGNNGIFNRAKTGKEMYANAQEYEKTEVAKSTNQIDSYLEGHRGFSSINYLTDEQDTGIKWTNNKSIYQKTYRNVSITSSKSTAIANADLPAIDELIDLTGIVKINTTYGNEYYSTSTYWGNNCYVTLRYIDTVGITYVMANWTSASADITIRYTKK